MAIVDLATVNPFLHVPDATKNRRLCAPLEAALHRRSDQLQLLTLALATC
jgi:hypothetical protein